MRSTTEDEFFFKETGLSFNQVAVIESRWGQVERQLSYFGLNAQRLAEAGCISDWCGTSPNEACSDLQSKCHFC